MKFKAGDIVIILPGFINAGTISRVKAVLPGLSSEVLSLGLPNYPLYFAEKVQRIDTKTLTKLERLIYGVK